MRSVALAVLAAAIGGGLLLAQEPKPVPKDSKRVSVPGCTKGYVFTVGRRTADEPGSADLPEGLHLRMNGAKKMMSEIKAHEGSMVEITGLMKKDDLIPTGIKIGGVRVTPGGGPGGGSLSATPIGANQVSIDVEGWRSIPGDCRTK